MISMPDLDNRLGGPHPTVTAKTANKAGCELGLACS